MSWKCSDFCDQRNTSPDITFDTTCSREVESQVNNLWPVFIKFYIKISKANVILLVFVCITAYEVRRWTKAASGASGWFDVSCAQTEAEKSKSLTQRLPGTNKPLCRTTKSCPISHIINFISTVQAGCIYYTCLINITHLLSYIAWYSGFYSL